MSFGIQALGRRIHVAFRSISQPPSAAGVMLNFSGTSTGVPSNTVNSFQPSFLKPNIVPGRARPHVQTQRLAEVLLNLAEHLAGLDDLDTVTASAQHGFPETMHGANASAGLLKIPRPKSTHNRRGIDDSTLPPARFARGHGFHLKGVRQVNLKRGTVE